MQSDPLQQLRDVHLPADPSWWPPAPGWWLIAIAVIALAGWAGMRLWRAWVARRPVRVSRSVMAQLHERYRNGELDALAYAQATNELLKRLLVRAYGREDLAPLTGVQWLQALDRISHSDQFSGGAGAALGSIRYRPGAAPEVAQLHRAVEALLDGVKP